MRNLKPLFAFGVTLLGVGAFAQTPPEPPRPPMPGHAEGHGPIGPGPLLDPHVQKALGLSKAQIAKIRALAPKPPKPGSKPPVPPKPGAHPVGPPPEEAKMEAVLTKAQRAKLKAMRLHPEPPLPPRPQTGAPRPRRS